MRASLIVSAVLVLAVAGGFMNGEEPPPGSPRRPAELPELVVKLLRPVREVRGVDVPDAARMRRIDSLRLNKPVLLSVELPGGTTAKLLLVTLFGEGCDSRQVTPRPAGSEATRGGTASR